MNRYLNYEKNENKNQEDRHGESRRSSEKKGKN